MFPFDGVIMNAEKVSMSLRRNEQNTKISTSNTMDEELGPTWSVQYANREAY